MVFHLGRCTIRSWRSNDVAALARHANNRKIWRNVRDRFPHPYTPAHALEWVRTAPMAEPETHFAIAVGEEAVGGIGLALGSDIQKRCAEIGFWLGEAYWGRGIATEAVAGLTAWTFKELDVHRLQAGVLAWNPASMRVLEKAGYEREACLRGAAFKDGHILDLIIYATLREPAPPFPPAAA